MADPHRSRLTCVICGECECVADAPADTSEYAATARALLDSPASRSDQIPTDENVGPFFSNAAGASSDVWQ